MFADALSGMKMGQIGPVSNDRGPTTRSTGSGIADALNNTSLGNVSRTDVGGDTSRPKLGGSGFGISNLASRGGGKLGGGLREWFADTGNRARLSNVLAGMATMYNPVAGQVAQGAADRLYAQVDKEAEASRKEGLIDALGQVGPELQGAEYMTPDHLTQILVNRQKPKGAGAGRPLRLQREVDYLRSLGWGEDQINQAIMGRFGVKHGGDGWGDDGWGDGSATPNGSAIDPNDPAWQRVVPGA